MDMPSRNIFRKLLMRHLRDDQTVVVSTHIMNDVENIVSDIIIVFRVSGRGSVFRELRGRVQGAERKHGRKRM